MLIPRAKDTNPARPLRLWPGVLAALLLLLVVFAVPLIVAEGSMFAIVGGLAGGLLILLWWLFFSRAPWSERLGAIVIMVIGVWVTRSLVDKSIANGMMGMMFVIYSIPVLGLTLVAWAVASRRISRGPRRVSMVAAILLACGIFTLLRTGGITGDGDSDLHWRWTETPEDRLLAQAREEPGVTQPAPAVGRPAGNPIPTPIDDKPASPATAPATAVAPERVGSAGAGEEPIRPAADAPGETEVEWPGFRGAGRDSIVHGVRIETDWSRSAPQELWRRPVGPGWSSFAVHGNRVFTQEQRGGDEMVSCYDLQTGAPVWRHGDAARFWESNAGAGPRATPTVRNGRVYSFGATGIVNALDAGNGAVVWSRNAATDAGKQIPAWGFASSPLAIDDLVIVAASGQLVAYEIASGNPRWFGPTRGGGYSSPQWMTLDGVPQVLLLSGGGATSVALSDGALLWEHSWAPGVGIVQPALSVEGDVLMTASDTMGGAGVRRLAVAHGTAGWTVEERWTSRGLKPYFNDFVVHKGHAFGFDGSILACIDLADGERKWKGGRYGHGQLLLLPDQDVLLVLGEEGELALVKAAPDRFVELARIPALEGKTWNHPVLVGDILLVRNGQEMAAFRLSLEGR